MEPFFQPLICSLYSLFFNLILFHSLMFKVINPVTHFPLWYIEKSKGRALSSLIEMMYEKNNPFLR